VDLDDDLAEMLKNECEQTGRLFRDVVNDAIRRGMVEAVTSRPVIEVPVFDLGDESADGTHGWDVLAREDGVRQRELTEARDQDSTAPH
jgi:hypothetical protein